MEVYSCQEKESLPLKYSAVPLRFKSYLYIMRYKGHLYAGDYFQIDFEHDRCHDYGVIVKKVLP